MDLLSARWTARSRRLAVALSAGSIGIAALASTSPAQAHEAWIAKAWGLNSSGQLGNGSSTGPEECGPERKACSTTPVQVHGLSGVTEVAGGPLLRNAFSVGLLQDGTVRAWGNNGFGELGNGTKGTENSSDVPVAVKELTGATAIAEGGEHALALLSNGTVMAWGENERGQLGDGSTVTSDVPVAVKELSGAVAVSAGSNFSLALLSNGTVMAWGFNNFGQLGDGSTTSSDVPVAVCDVGETAPCSKDLSGVVAIAAGGEHALALLSNGTVAAWGLGKEGQLGDGGETESDVPAAVSGLSGVTDISAGAQHSLALLGNGTVDAWGSNEHGELGDGSSMGPEMCGVLMTACSKKPLAVSGLSGVRAIAAGADHSLVLTTDGTVRSWGLNESGQLGLGTSLGPEPCGPAACSTKPLQVTGLGGIKGIAGGGQHSLAFGPPPPSVAALTPDEVRGHGATTVTISGADLEEAIEVKFGSVEATSFTVNSESSITAVAPAGKGTVDVTVTTRAGTSATSEADRFFYSKPTVKKLSPRKGPEAGGTSVTIIGSNFTGAAAVKFGSANAASYTVKSATEIVAVSPPQPGGKVDVTVSSANGTSAVTSKDRFRYRS